MKLILVLLLITITLISCSPKEELNYRYQKESPKLSLGLCPLVKQNSFILKKRKTFRVLAIDGGGVRGIIPARILAEFERRSGKPASALFDLMVGNSTGGLIVLALNTPNELGKPIYKASDIVDLYNQQAKSIFNTSLFRKLYTGFGLWSPKYNRNNYDKILKDFFGSTTMSQLIKPTAVISYNLNTALPHIWAREYARQKPHRDFLVSDIAAATSAAPTYFAPKLLTDKDNESEYQADGGIFANNPESVAANLAFELDDKLERKDMILISLGTGTIKMNTKPINLGKAGIIGWVIKANLIDVMMGTQSEWYDAEIGYAYPNSCRLQLSLDKKNSAMDNTSQANLKTLIELTDDYINNNSDLIDYIIKMLLDNPKV